MTMTVEDLRLAADKRFQQYLDGFLTMQELKRQLQLLVDLLPDQ